MDNASKKKIYTKSRLVKELAFKTGITQNQSKAALEAIIEIAYREAKANYFILPGLCKFDVVHRNERSVRNPATGEVMVLPPRDVLHVSLSKRAKETVVPRVSPMKLEEYEEWKKANAPAVAEPIPEPVAAVEPPPAPEPAVAEPAAEPIAAVEPPPAPEPVAAELPPVEASEPPQAEPPVAEAPAPETVEKEISFRCPNCGQEVLATSEAIGCEAECPACGSIIVVPPQSEAGTTCAPGGDTTKEIISSQQAEDLVPEAMKHRTIRIDSALLEDITGPAAAQPQDDAEPSEAMKNRTLRIDLPDEF